MTQLFATPPKLGKRQAFVLDQVGKKGTLSALTAGLLYHRWHGGKTCACTRGDVCDYAATDGRSVLESLRRKGLVKRDRHWTYRLADRPSSQDADDIPY